MLDTFLPNPCFVDKSLTWCGAVADIAILLSVIAIFYALSRVYPNWKARVGIMFGGVFIFELFTSPMWVNPHFGFFAYAHRDVTYVLTLGWTALFLGVLFFVERYFASHGERARFAASVFLITVLGFIAEIALVAGDLREYAPEVKERLVGLFFLDVPVEAFYYIPVFSSLVLGFYKYALILKERALIAPVKKGKHVRNFVIAFVGVFLFELMIEPMVVNAQFPAWSYVYHDISIVMTLGWIVLLWLTTTLVGRFLPQVSEVRRFFLSLVAIAAFAAPIEEWLITHGYRIYSASAQADFSGFLTPITHMPIEVVFAVPCYFALILGFVNYWKITLDNKA
ncbi:MAG: hypothetical protein A3C93_00305 [Candidatus Lloydbacteria bacterium RIFCSPHIGHO2_02_FULL_54_17]|uniref:Uncharacterized protein n=1 Tax=Candidatus Lloydbacteria bacterium RIFCSPHIGHO2_02_FULL_54_17 TaxID=1798664 RepID=A0A1G2DG43_9BACT|nr:MAG: hypothetical protein A2762_01995 [Candidatus Lloydbacteria bacterium RIFCSPHIGHO2_01_FULL_54_11]OGZ11830.1 MAG: hypothetical protein A3C93_00305 [Candidatus Lloydbacteria bacterium RIFCSPHIGHO2_02_FULL_54_17]OGZ14148.1 MAG: hypothetical protein A2948_03480 [Candidatus Lloydbacteria bacterium RIFCSPLOWO2_01_FULL_54_18]OGZ16676.1 MAG: hypothetical protein A3H76_00010 [Candidatus Lloydbacteria bacterium RIFCSPLOWO2_02_FULL_54_12]